MSLKTPISTSADDMMNDLGKSINNIKTNQDKWEIFIARLQRAILKYMDIMDELDVFKSPWITFYRSELDKYPYVPHKQFLQRSVTYKFRLIFHRVTLHGIQLDLMHDYFQIETSSTPLIKLFRNPASIKKSIKLDDFENSVIILAALEEIYAKIKPVYDIKENSYSDILKESGLTLDKFKTTQS